jgi:hypothetical protein
MKSNYTLLTPKCKQPKFQSFCRMLLFMLALFITQQAAAQTLPVFTLSVTSTAESCTGNGQLQMSVSGADAGATIIYRVYKSPDFALAVATYNGTATDVVAAPGLGAGTYRVVATQSKAGYTSNTKQWDGSITSTIATLTLGAPSTTVSLISGGTDQSTGSVTINVASGNPATYYTISGPTTVAPQTSNVLTGLKAGTYLVACKDVCGNVVTQQVTVGSSQVYTGQGFWNPNFTSWGMNVNSNNPPLFRFWGGGIQLSLDCAGTMFQYYPQSNLPDGYQYAFPVDLTITVHPPVGSSASDYVEHLTVTSDNIGTVHTGRLPYYTDDFVITVTSVDALGNTQTSNSTFTSNGYTYANPKINVNIAKIYCGMKGSANIRFFPEAAPLSFTINSAPSGITNSNFTVDKYAAYIEANELTAGDYDVTITNGCGFSYHWVFNVSVAPLTLFHVNAQPDYCHDGMGSFRAAFEGNATNIIKAELTPYPSGTTVDISSYIVSGSKRIEIDNIAPGQYTLTLTSECNEVISQQASIPSSSMIVSETTLPACGYSTLQLDIKPDRVIPFLYGDNTDIGFWGILQKFNPSTGTWEEIQHQVYHWFSHELAAAQIKTNSYGPLYTSGQYRIFLDRDLCKPVLWQGYISVGAPLVEGVYNLPCNPLTASSNPTIVMKEGAGVKPFTYKIIKKDGADFVIDNGSSPNFSGLAAGNYTYEITDACSNSVQGIFSTTTLPEPHITPSNLCDGSAGSLSMPDFGSLEYKWYKSTAPTTILSTTNTLTFSSFNSATDAGTYSCHVTSVSGTGCVDVTYSFTIPTSTTSLNAGADHTATVCSTTTAIDLSGYLDAGIANYGTWEETTTAPSGLLVGSIWYPSQAAAGTYTFKYTLKGLCTGTDEAVITVVNGAPSTVSITYGSSAYCSDVTSATVTLTGTGNYTGGTYSSTAGLSIDAGTGVINPSTSTPGTYTITYTLTGACGATATTQITVNSSLSKPTITTTAATCSFAGTATISNYNSAYTYTFTPSGPSVGTGGVITSMTAGTNYTVTAGNGTCTSTASAQFSVAAQLPGTSLSLSPASQTVCAGESATVNATVSGGATVTSWVSDLGGITATGGVSLTTGALPNKGDQPYTITLTASATNGTCGTNQQATITVLPEPGVVIYPKSAVVCDYEIPGLVISSLLSGTTIDWELVYTATNAHVSSGSGIDTVKPFAAALPSGAYTLKVTGKKAGCKSKVVTASVIVN